MSMYRKINTGWIKHIDFEIIDILCMELSFLLSYYLRHREYLDHNLGLYQRLCLMIILFDAVVILFSGNYNGIIQRNEGKELLAVIEHVTVVNGLLLVYEFIMKESDILSRAVFLMSWGTGIILCFLARTGWKTILRKRITSEKNQGNMLLISTEGHVGKCVQQLYQKPYRDYKICSVAVLNSEEQDEVIDANIPLIYGRSNLMEYVRTNVVDRVFIDTYDNGDLNELVDIFLSMGITVHIGMGFLPENLPNQFLEKFGSGHAVTTSINTARSWELAVKRAIDIVGSLVGLVLCGIAFIFVAPAIKKASPGPIFFAQDRVGKNGRIFKFYKFRSMYMDAEERKKELMEQNEMQGLMFKMENDPRIIGSEKGPGKGIGNFIRKTSLDELPQFWNILKGDMSLVGTRPPTKAEYEQYDFHHKIRLSMKPGLTGMWQTSGRSDITDFEEIVKLDAQYIENWSLTLDLKLLFKTVAVVLKKEGSK